jgi:glucan phosphorylase
MQLKKFIETTCNKPISECSNQELYLALLSYTKEQIKEKETPCNDKKKLYYISAEFLIGKLLSNNLINLGIRPHLQHMYLNSRPVFQIVKKAQIENHVSKHQTCVFPSG